MAKQRIPAWAALAAALTTLPILTGCGTPAAPQPPSLQLPEKVENLTAERSGASVLLNWTMPKKNTDKLLLKGSVDVRICRKLEDTDPCVTALSLQANPGEEATATDTLPAELTSGSPRPLRYFVELRNRNGRSAGLSKSAIILAGQAPEPITGLTVELRKQGAVLRWSPQGQTPDATIRLHRKLLTPPAPKAGQQNNLLAPEPEQIEQVLTVDAAKASQAIDSSIRFGESYRYTAQRVVRITVDGQTLELAGELTPPVTLDAKDIFPPATPTGLAAVATAASADAPGLETAIDLSWQPVSDATVAGYLVYRRETSGDWQRLTTAAVIAPAYHDTQVRPGHSYLYAVSAIGQNGHESARSAAAQESIPAQ